MKRITTLQAAIKEKYDYLAVFNNTNITYVSGFPGATVVLIPQTGKATLLVSEVNYEQAKAETNGFEVKLQLRGENLMERIAKETNAQKLAIDNLSIETWRALSKAVGGEEKLESASQLLLDLRLIKDEEEIGLIREACKIAQIGIETAAATVRAGITEREVAAEVEYAMRKAGSEGTSFDTIIASGASSAFPHGSCTDRKIHEGDLVVVDLGATYHCYRSDMTRTFTAGKPSEKQTQIYEITKIAQQKGIEAIKSSIAAINVDGAARQVIDSAGFGQFYVHGFGHGVGLEVHEAPIVSLSSKDFLSSGNVITAEPGIYLPGYGGVRIEDTVLVTEKSAERLTGELYSLQP